MQFRILAVDGRTRGRVGEIETAHGSFRTPAFLPVGTRAAVRGMPPWQLEELGAEIVLCNAYHLHLRPGDEAIRELGGLHRFMGWSRPILTDSGGYQIFSLLPHRTVRDEGVEFRDPVGGSLRFFTPESVVEIQRNLGSDILMPLDCPVGHPAGRSEAERALALTRSWLDRSFAHARDRGLPGQDLFAIVQGSVFPDLRRAAVEHAMSFDPPGLAIGGLAVGEPPEQMHETAALTASLLPPHRPRYLMGVGTPEDIVRAVAAGVDLFDCILPTRLGRTGWAFTGQGRLKIRNAAFRADDAPVDPGCACPTCRRFSRAYLRHCFHVGEMLGPIALTIHNLFFYLRWMDRIRAAIESGRLADLLPAGSPA